MTLIDDLKENIQHLRDAHDQMLDECLLLANLREVLAEKIGTRIAECATDGDTYPDRVGKALGVMLAELDATKARRRG